MHDQLFLLSESVIVAKCKQNHGHSSARLIDQWRAVLLGVGVGVGGDQLVTQRIGGSRGVMAWHNGITCPGNAILCGRRTVDLPS